MSHRKCYLYFEFGNSTFDSIDFNFCFEHQSNLDFHMEYACRFKKVEENVNVMLTEQIF